MNQQINILTMSHKHLYAGKEVCVFPMVVVSTQVYCLMRKLDQITIDKMHLTLYVWSKVLVCIFLKFHYLFVNYTGEEHRFLNTKWKILNRKLGIKQIDVVFPT